MKINHCSTHGICFGGRNTSVRDVGPRMCLDKSLPATINRSGINIPTRKKRESVGRRERFTKHRS